MLTKLSDFVCGRGVSTAAVNAGGTGYVVGDVLSVLGGTSSAVAQAEVTTVAAGVVTAVIMVQSGTYTVDPSLTANAVTGGTGTGCTLNLTMANVGWTKKRETFYAVSAVVAAGGTGYAVGNILTVTGGTFMFAARFNVTTVSAGAVTGLSLNDKGEYTTSPSNPAATTGGAGSGCTLTVTYDANRNQILQGVGSGSDQVFVGIRTFVSSGSNNWELAGMTGYNAASLYTAQPGISPGRYDTPTPETSCYVPLNNATFSYWLFANGRRIVAVFKMGTTYCNMYLGLINPYAVALDYPYPLAVFGCSSLHSQLFSGSDISLSGLTDPIGHILQTPMNGPCEIRDPGGSWLSVQNSRVASGARGAIMLVNVFPCGSPSAQQLIPIPTLADFDNATQINTFLKFVPNTGLPGVAAYLLNQTPDTPSYVSPLVPAMLFESVPVRQFLGELDNVFWVSALGQTTNLLTEDTITIAGVRYKVFQNCNRTDLWAFLAIRYE